MSRHDHTTCIVYCIFYIKCVFNLRLKCKCIISTLRVNTILRIDTTKSSLLQSFAGSCMGGGDINDNNVLLNITVDIKVALFSLTHAVFKFNVVCQLFTQYVLCCIIFIA